MIRVIDSHTGGQPTRVIVEGGPDLGTGPLSERLDIFERSFDAFRKQTVLEPKCSDAMVGALLCEPSRSDCSAGVIFYNTAGYLGMCGHGLIGLMVTLAYMGQLKPGNHLIETPVGVVETTLLDTNHVQFENVDAHCLHRNITVDVPSLGPVVGDIAWGGNWFFLAKETPYPLVMDYAADLTEAGWAIRKALTAAGITGDDGREIDHIEFFEKPRSGTANSKSFVLCPGGAYDRSPCGTGTSAKLACLEKAGLLTEGEDWVQESFIGSQFKASYRRTETGSIKPTITGSAYVYGDTNLIHQDGDPFQYGIPG